MANLTFVSWVEGPANQMREGRAEIGRVARGLLPEHWSLPSPDPGWTYKDLLAHLATGDWLCRTILRDVLGIEKGIPEDHNMSFVTDGNARLLEERKDAAVEDLIAEAGREGEKTQELLSKITEQTERAAVVWYRSKDEPVTLEQWVTQFPGHDTFHVGQLKTALDQVMM